MPRNSAARCENPFPSHEARKNPETALLFPQDHLTENFFACRLSHLRVITEK